MSSSLYPLWKQSLLAGDANAALDATVAFVLVDTATYTFDAADQFYSDLSGIAQASGSDAVTTIANKSFTNGVFDTSDDVSTTAALDATATTYEAIVVFVDTGVAGTSRLVAYIDGFTAVAPNGGTVGINWDDGGNVLNGIFSL